MDIQRYLKRIHYTDIVKPDVQTLHGLQRAHLMTIPFENLDIGLKRSILLDEASLWNKIVLRGRGGFCYEVNGLFATLLKVIGYDVTYLNARDYHEEDDTFGIDFDHLTLLVRVPNESTRWLVDVGWGDTFTLPLNMESVDWQEQGLRAYKLEAFRDGYQILQRGYHRELERHYYFDLTPHQFPTEYEAACLYHQTSPESIFTRKRIVSRLTDTGRISLDGRRSIITTHGQRQEHPFEADDEFYILLEELFNITLHEEKR